MDFFRFLSVCPAVRSDRRKTLGPKQRSRKLSFDCLEQRNLLSATAAGDFNGDGAEDLAIGIPNQKVGTVTGAGAVNVVYGAVGTGLTGASETWNQDSSGVVDAAEVDDHFGAAVAAGDFNGDGFDDLAIGVPQQDVAGQSNAGVVQILFGSSGGLTSTGNQFWRQGSSGILDDVEQDDLFGWALVSGDFNNDGRADLAIGVPGEGEVTEGIVQILFGSLTVGLTSSGNRRLFGGGNNGRLGSALAAGDFNCDNLDDLAAGAPGYSVSGFNQDHGAIVVYYTADSFGAETLHQDSTLVEDVAEPGDRFGSAVTVGDFNADGFDDIAVGIPGEDIGSAVDAGAIQVFPGSAGACSVGFTADVFWSQDTSGVLDVAESNDLFGASVQAGDFNADGRADLAIGVPGESLDSGTNIITAAGAVNVLNGASSGLLTSTGNQFWHQNTSGILGTIGPNEQFGATLSAGDFNGDSRPDLVVSVPSEESCSGRIEALNVLYASAAGLTSTGNQLWRQVSSGAFQAGEEADLQVHHGMDVLLIDTDGDLNVATAHSTIFDTFTLWGTNPVNAPPERYRVADFNGDHLSDVLSIEAENGGIDSFYVRTAKTGGGFNSAVYWQGGVVNTLERYKIGDFNGDGLSDVLLFDPAGNFIVWTAKIGGGFNFARTWNQNGADIGAARYKLGDFNGDGRTDVASFEENAVFYVWTANTAGDGFNNYQRWGWNGQDIGTDRYQIGDFNGDHRADVISFEANGGIYVWTANSNGSFNQFKRWGTNTSGEIGALRYKLADFDGDLRTDVIAFESNGAFKVWTAANGDQFNNSVVWNTNGGDIGQDRYRVGDVNGDGRADVSSFEANGGIYVWLAKNTPGFVNFTRWGTFDPASLLPSRIILAEFQDPASSSAC